MCQILQLFCNSKCMFLILLVVFDILHRCLPQPSMSSNGANAIEWQNVQQCHAEGTFFNAILMGCNRCAGEGMEPSAERLNECQCKPGLVESPTKSECIPCGKGGQSLIVSKSGQAITKNILKQVWRLARMAPIVCDVCRHHPPKAFWTLIPKRADALAVWLRTKLFNWIGPIRIEITEWPRQRKSVSNVRMVQLRTKKAMDACRARGRGASAKRSFSLATFENLIGISDRSFRTVLPRRAAASYPPKPIPFFYPTIIHRIAFSLIT